MPKGLPRRRDGSQRFALAEPPNDRRAWPVRSDPRDLTLVHVTASHSALAILESETFVARACTVFTLDEGGKKRARPMVYFFALKPAYRMKAGDSPAAVSSRFPFAFLVSPKNIDRGLLAHVYPFDTGGAAVGAFDDAALGGLTNLNDCLEDFQLGGDLAAAERHIGWAFGSRQAYFEGRLQLDLANAVPNFSAWRTYISIANLGVEGSPQADKRASAIEVAYGGNVPVVGNVEYAILPDAFLQDENGENAAIMAALRRAGIHYTTYRWQPSRTPNSYHADITRLTRAYLQAKDRL